MSERLSDVSNVHRQVISITIHIGNPSFYLCVYLLCVCVCVRMCARIQSHLTLCDPRDCGPLGSSVHVIFQARILEWVSISYSRESSQPREQTQVSCIGRQVLYHCAAWEACDLGSLCECVHGHTHPYAVFHCTSQGRKCFLC